MNKIEPVVIKGEKYVSVRQFARLVNHSEQSIYMLIRKGNSQRKLKAIKYVSRVFIPLDEVKDFPFTAVGKSNQEIYHYNLEETKGDKIAQ